MKVIFEYEDGTYRIVPTSLSRIEDRNQNNCLIDEYIVDKDLEKMYIIADDNHLGPFKKHRDLQELYEEDEYLKNRMLLNAFARKYYINLIEKAGENV